jgi:sugar lactone lactonase YvrE
MFPTEVAGTGPQISFTMPANAEMIMTPTVTVPKFAEEVLSFGAEGTGPGRFDDTRSIAVDSDGFIYTAEYSDRRIQKFSPEGKYVLGWSADGSNPVLSMSVSRSGVVYIVTTGDVLKYDLQGNPIGKLANPNKDYIDSVVITADNGLVVASNDAIYRFDDDEQLLFQIDEPHKVASDNGSISGAIAVDGLGNIYAPIRFVQQGKFKTSIFVFTPEGKYSNRFGSDGNEPGQFRALQSVVVDGTGRIYVSDIKGIQVYSPEGAYLTSIDLEGVAFGLWFDDAGALYAASNADKIIKFKILE